MFKILFSNWNDVVLFELCVVIITNTWKLFLTNLIKENSFSPILNTKWQNCLFYQNENEICYQSNLGINHLDLI